MSEQKSPKKEVMEEKNDLLPDPNKLLYEFLTENNLKLVVSTFEQGDTPFVGTGFVLTDKPLLKITVEYGRI